SVWGTERAGARAPARRAGGAHLPAPPWPAPPRRTAPPRCRPAPGPGCAGAPAPVAHRADAGTRATARWFAPPVAPARPAAGPRRGVLELQRAVVRFPVLLDRLEQYQRVARPVPQLVFREVRGDRVDPGRELLRLVEPVQVPKDPDEHLLNQVFGPFPVPDGSIDEIEQASLVTVDQRAERLGVARQVLEHQSPVVELVQRPPLQGARRDDVGLPLVEGRSHEPLPD